MLHLRATCWGQFSKIPPTCNKFFQLTGNQGQLPCTFSTMACIQNKHTHCVNSWHSNFFQRMHHSEQKMLIYLFLKITNCSGCERNERKLFFRKLKFAVAFWEKLLRITEFSDLTLFSLDPFQHCQGSSLGSVGGLPGGLTVNTPQTIAEWMTPASSCILERTFNLLVFQIIKWMVCGHTCIKNYEDEKTI